MFTSKQEKLKKALFEAVEKSDITGIDKAIHAGADIQAKNAGGMTALHWAASRGDIDSIEVLVRHGADVHAKDKNGKTAAMLARENGEATVTAKLEAYEKQYSSGPRPSEFFQTSAPPNIYSSGPTLNQPSPPDSSTDSSYSNPDFSQASSSGFFQASPPSA